MAVQLSFVALALIEFVGGVATAVGTSRESSHAAHAFLLNVILEDVLSDRTNIVAVNVLIGPKGIIVRKLLRSLSSLSHVFALRRTGSCWFLVYRYSFVNILR